MSADLVQLKRRMTLMIAVDAVCAVIAVGAAVGGFVHHIAWLNWVFFVAVGAGFAAQFWFIAGFRRANKGA